MAQYKLALISPGREGSVVSGRWKWLFNFYRLTLPVLAALTDQEKYQIEAFDECVDSRIPLTGFDLVAMSVMTPYAPRAYDLARQFQAQGAKVILGGPHVMLLPDEAEKHADAIAIGDAELIWPQILDDFEHERLQSRYVAGVMDISANRQRILPNRSVLRTKSLMVFSTAETSRGCPHNCEHCVIAAIYRGVHRHHPIETIEEDFASIPGRNIFVVDDNLAGSSQGSRKRTKEILRAITPLNKRWFSQATIQFADDPELLELAARSGCAGVYIGLESILEASLRETRKVWSRPNAFAERLKRIRDHGIFVEVGLMFGFDNDSPDVFEQTAEFVHQTGIESPNAHLLTPYPGTRLFQRLEREGRILTRDWSLYNTGHVVFQPTQMTPDQLRTGYEWWYRQVFSPIRICQRVWQSNFRGYSLLINILKAAEVHRQFGWRSQPSRKQL
jgi:radical SAM superfamily enzyme YgiQ (UPF0313 family)